MDPAHGGRDRFALAACGSETAPGDDATQRYAGSFLVLEAPDHGPELCDGARPSDPPQYRGLLVSGWDGGAVEDEKSQGGTTWGSWYVVGTYDGERFTLVEGPTTPQPSDEPVREPPGPACDVPEVVRPSDGASTWVAMSQDYGPFEIPGLVSAWLSNTHPKATEPFVGNVVVRPSFRAAATATIRQHYGGRLCVVERDEPTPAELTEVQRQVMDEISDAALGRARSTMPGQIRGVVVTDVWVADDKAKAYAAERWGKSVELRGRLQIVD